ncbi:hypothetical protein [Pseudomonas yamanorum]|uniref:hypothetical protein n=1 Tax=Pseudomonas yamanorum TaxID=515393 RepID=UPI002ED60743|nr:hypothetical protein VYI69_12160 [Pseudomonas yamanorum]
MKKNLPESSKFKAQHNVVTSSLRILIADSRSARSLEIERALNGHGYYRISPLRMFSELEAALENAVETFDLLLISHEISGSPDVDLRDFCRVNPMVRHFVIYGDPHAIVGPMDIWPPRVQLNMSRLPDSELLGRVMNVIELPTRAKAFR